MCKSTDKTSALEAVISHVRDAVACFRRRGIKTDAAIPDVADALGLSPRRTKSLFYRDGLWAMAAIEKAKVEARLGELLDREIALSVQYTEQLRQKRERVREVTVCEKSQRPGFGSGSTGSRSISAA